MFTLTHTIEGIKVNVHVYKLIITMLLQLQGERERGIEYITQCACALLVHYMLVNTLLYMYRMLQTLLDCVAGVCVHFYSFAGSLCVCQFGISCLVSRR